MLDKNEKVKHFISSCNNVEHQGKVVDSKDGFDVIECQTCQFKHVIPIPGPAELEELYEEKFYSKERPKYFKETEEDLDWWNINYQTYYQLFEKYCPGRKGKVLDIGSGPGYFLKYGKEIGWDVLGFEPSQQAYQYSTKLGLNIVNDFFNAEKAQKYGKFDVVYMNAVIEHLADPIGLIKDVKKVLKPDGLICIIAPNDYNPLQNILKNNLRYDPWWVAPPQHLNFFDFKSIKKLLERLDFEIVESTTSFPMEFFLLSGDNYVGNDELGRKCHQKRKIFEANMYKYGPDYLKLLYKFLADHNLGRDFVIIARNKDYPYFKKRKEAIWLFAGGDMQEIAAKKFKEFGYKLILTDISPNCFCRKYADEFVRLNISDIKGNLEVAKDLKKKYQIKAVFTTATDLATEAVANIAKFLDLPGVNPQIAHICHFKLETRRLLSKAGILQPKFRKVSNLKETKDVAKEIKLPIVLKASDSAASRGFTKIDKLSDLIPDVLKRAIEAGTTGYAIAEELLFPLESEIAEQSVETLWYNGKMFWLNWVDRLFRKDFLLFESLKNENIYRDIPWSIELGHINPAIHDYQTKKNVEDLIYQAGLALGLNKEKWGHILKADIILTKKGPYILEMTTRLSGGWDSSFSTPQRGADFVGGAIRLALGEKLDLPLRAKYFQYKNPNLFSTVLSLIPENPKDCMGRKFAEGSSFDREESIRNAYKNLLAGKYISKGNPQKVDLINIKIS